MAINPIQLFQSGQNNILDVLNSGQNVIGGMFDRAIQLGRDSVNNQRKQDGDLQQQRQFETSMFQRRAEGLQQNNEDAQRNARNAFESDRKFNYATSQDAFQNARLSANDIFSQTRATNNDEFSQGMQEKNYNLNASNILTDNSREDSKLQASRDAARAEQITQQNLMSARVGAAGDGPSITAEQMFAPKDSIVDEVNVGDFNSGRGPKTTTTTSTSTTTKFSPERILSAKAVLGNPKATATDLKMANAVLNPNGAAAGGLKPQTRADMRAEERFEMQKDGKAQAEKVNQAKLLVADTSAFLPQTPQALRRDSDDVAAIAEAKAYDKDRFASEVNSAKNMSVDEYVAKVPSATEPQKAKRRQLWEYANGGAPAAESKPTEIKSIPTDSLVVGKAYKGADGTTKIWKGNGQWQ